MQRKSCFVYLKDNWICSFLRIMDYSKKTFQNLFFIDTVFLWFHPVIINLINNQLMKLKGNIICIFLLFILRNKNCKYVMHRWSDKKHSNYKNWISTNPIEVHQVLPPASLPPSLFIVKIFVPTYHCSHANMQTQLSFMMHWRFYKNICYCWWYLSEYAFHGHGAGQFRLSMTDDAYAEISTLR